MAEQTIGPALGEDAYRALHEMQLSPDPGQQAQAAALAKKLTPGEQQEFFDYQKQANAGKGELTRPDATVMGMPPELAVWGGARAVQAVGGAVAGAGVSLGSRVFAGAKAAIDQAAPAVKYELVKSGLVHLGVPGPVAAVAGMAVSGYRRGGGKAAAEAAPAEAATSPVASPAGTPPPEAPPATASAAAPSPAPQAASSGLRVVAKSPQQLLNEEAIAARRQYAQLRLQGKTDEQAKAILATTQQLQQSGPFDHLPNDFEMAQDMTKRAMSGQKSLMGAYGPK